MNRTRISFLAMFLAILMPGRLQAKFGLEVRPAEMRLSGIKVGQIYNVRRLKNVPYILKNLGDEAVEVQVSSVKPPKNRLKEGYEPIPDTNWVRVVPNKFQIPLGGSSYGEILISIPNDPKWVNRHYHVSLQGATLGTGFFSAAVRSHLLISTGPPPKIKIVQLEIPDFELDPPVFSLFNFPTGRKVNVGKELRRSIRIINKSGVKFKFHFESVPFGQVSLPRGYEVAPDSVTVKLSRSTFKLKPDTIKRLGLTISLPADAHGKKYAVLLKGKLLDYPVDVESFVTVLINAEKKEEEKDQENKEGQ